MADERPTKGALIEAPSFRERWLHDPVSARSSCVTLVVDQGVEFRRRRRS